MTSLSIDPKRGDIWHVDLNPVRGSEIMKTRPCVVVSSDAFRTVPVRVVVPLTELDDKKQDRIWCVPVEPDRKNRLGKASAADTLQIRCVALERFRDWGGTLAADKLKEILDAIAIVVEYDHSA